MFRKRQKCLLKYSEKYNIIHINESIYARKKIKRTGRKNDVETNGWRNDYGSRERDEGRKQIDWARDEYRTDNFITFVLIFFAVLPCPS